MRNGNGFVIYSPTLEMYFRYSSAEDAYYVGNSVIHGDANDATYYTSEKKILKTISSLSIRNPDTSFVIRTVSKVAILTTDKDITPVESFQHLYGVLLVELEDTLQTINALSDEELSKIPEYEWVWWTRKQERLSELRYKLELAQNVPN